MGVFYKLELNQANFLLKAATELRYRAIKCEKCYLIRQNIVYLEQLFFIY